MKNAGDLFWKSIFFIQITLNSFKDTVNRFSPSLLFLHRYIFSWVNVLSVKRKKNMQKPSANTKCVCQWGGESSLCTQGCNSRGGEKQRSKKAFLCRGRISLKECAWRSPRSFSDDVRSVNVGHLVYYFPRYWIGVQFWDVWKLGRCDHIIIPLLFAFFFFTFQHKKKHQKKHLQYTVKGQRENRRR